MPRGLGHFARYVMGLGRDYVCGGVRSILCAVIAGVCVCVYKSDLIECSSR